MKIRNPHLLRCAAWLGAYWLRCWMTTVRKRVHCIGDNVEPTNRQNPGRYIYSFWHENIPLCAAKYRAPDVHVLISMHRDGQLITDIAQSLGFSVVRGSAGRKGAVEAVRKLLTIAESRQHIVFTPDGPRGPRRIVQLGIVYLAAKSGVPIVPVCVGYRNAWRAKSWDRLALPKLFTQTNYVFGEPISIPPDVEPEALEIQRLRVQSAMDEHTWLAEQWAETGKLTFPSKPFETKRAEAA